MLNKVSKLTALAAGVAMSASAFADVTITVNDTSGAVGGTATMTYDYAALDADNVGGFQFDLAYNPAELTPSNISNCGVNRPSTHNASCTEPNGADGGLIRILIADFTAPTDEIMPLNIAPFGEVEFTIDAQGTHTVTFQNAAASDTSGGTVAISGNNATVTGTITGAAGYSSSPAPGAMIDLGSAIVGNASSMSPQNITVSEIGDQQLDVQAPAFSGPNASAFSSTTGMFSIADGGAPVDVDMNCTPDARGALTADVNLANNSVNAPDPSYSLSCAGLAPMVSVTPGVGMVTWGRLSCRGPPAPAT